MSFHFTNKYIFVLQFVQKTFKLCKLKKKTNISSKEAGQLDQYSLSDLDNHVANNALLEVRIQTFYVYFLHSVSNLDYDAHIHNRRFFSYGQDILDPNGSSEPEASNNHNDVHNHCSSVDTYGDERSNQHNIVDVDEGFEVPSNLKYLVEEDTISTDLLYKDGLYSRSLFGELLAEPEATNNLNWIQNRYITKKEDGEFLNSTLADKNKADLQEGNTQWCLAADGEGFSLPCIGALTESSNSMEKSSKRPRRM